MERADWHIFQVLTKRHEKLAELAPRLPWPKHIWAGVTIENNRFAHRADYLRLVPSAVRFISAEPVLGPVPDHQLHGLDWVITGGESGPINRPPKPDWFRDLRDQCVAAEVAFFFKQRGWPHLEIPRTASRRTCLVGNADCPGTLPRAGIP